MNIVRPNKVVSCFLVTHFLRFLEEERLLEILILMWYLSCIVNYNYKKYTMVKLKWWSRNWTVVMRTYKSSLPGLVSVL